MKCITQLVLAWLCNYNTSLEGHSLYLSMTHYRLDLKHAPTWDFEALGNGSFSFVDQNKEWQYCNVCFFLQNPSKEKVYLSGYGVELAIKSTEYKAKDDTQVKGEFLF